MAAIAPHSYPWERFWYPRGEPLSLSDDYLPDYEALNPSAVRLQTLSAHRCLVRLGEAGAGKSNELLRLAPSDRHVDGSGEAVVIEDMVHSGGPQELFADLERREVFKTWRHGGHDLVLYLDGLDEALMEGHNLVRPFIRALDRRGTDRLKLRVACRPALWPPTLETGLRRLWPDAPLAVYEIAPLRRSDVAALARAHGWDPPVFLRKIDEARSLP